MKDTLTEENPTSQRIKSVQLITHYSFERVVALPEQPPKIDWAMYKNKVPNPAMVDEFQKKYDTFKIPLPEDNVSSIIAAEEKQAVRSYILIINNSLVIF
ncbi:Atp5hp [Homalodisca vitripennis]|nr:Atp5hp [Homalodisca vitripennis]